jgi:hypothetical protein
MRYEDWDVLLFPGGIGGHVPLKEFKTACCSAQYKVNSNGNVQGQGMGFSTASSLAKGSSLTSYLLAVKIAPLMTCFVPSLEPGAPFQISIHVWNKKEFTLPPPSDSIGCPQAWQIVIIVDGAIVWYTSS